MADSGGEIEYLDEDAEIVQHCVQNLPSTTSVNTPEYFIPRPRRTDVRRSASQKRKRKDDDDSEYEPSDEPPPSPPSPPPAKKRVTKPVKQLRYTPSALPSTFSYLKINKHPHLYQPSVHELFLKRKRLNIQIPDYDDPLCLPVRAVRAEDSDRKRLTNWNNVCLEHFKKCDTLLKPEQGCIKSSVRTAMFKNVVNKQTGQMETTIWSKVCVENEESDKKSEILQCVLPRYREKKALPNYSVGGRQLHNSEKTISEVILSKETHKDGDALVVYKPQDSVSAVYGLIDKRKKVEDEEQPTARDEDSKLFLKELTACRVCAPCFQSSWRGLTKPASKCVVCPVCARVCVTAYNLLSHFKIHSAQEVARHKKIISHLLVKLVGYHYKCRVCRRKFDSIRSLRTHVKEHQGKERFTCNVCNRVVNGR